MNYSSVFVKNNQTTKKQAGLLWPYNNGYLAVPSDVIKQLYGVKVNPLKSISIMQLWHMLFIELSSHKTILQPSILGYIVDTAYLCWCHWSGAVETVLNDSRNQRVIRNGVTVYGTQQQTGQGHQDMLLPCAKLP